MKHAGAPLHGAAVGPADLAARDGDSSDEQATRAEAAQLEQRFEAHFIAEHLAQRDGLGALFDVALHALLLAKLGGQMSAAQLAGAWLSLCIGLAQGAAFVGRRKAYVRWRLPIITLRRISAAVLICACTNTIAASAHCEAWAAARLLVVSSAALLNLNYVLWNTTKFWACFALNAAAMSLVLTLSPNACAHALAGSGGGGGCAMRRTLLRLGSAMHSAGALPAALLVYPQPSWAWALQHQHGNCSTPDSSSMPWAAGADVPLVPQACVAPAGAVGGPLVSDDALLPLCSSLVGTFQLTVGIIVPAYVIFMAEQRHRVRFLQAQPRAAWRCAHKFVSVWWCGDGLLLWLVGFLWVAVMMQLAWTVLLQLHANTPMTL